MLINELCKNIIDPCKKTKTHEQPSREKCVKHSVIIHLFSLCDFSVRHSDVTHNHIECIFISLITNCDTKSTHTHT